MDTGTRLGPYEIQEQLGAGGMGEVWLAHDHTLGRRVAIKFLAAEMAADPERRARFRREAQAIAALEHPNIVAAYAVEEIDGHSFLTMQLVEGEDLGDLIPPEGIPITRLLDLAIGIADGVACAHDRGITHRDLKPSNVMVNREGRPMILDFGLAKVAAEPEAVSDDTSDQTKHLTEQGAVLGTVSYMSPEQAEGKPVDGRSDIFSFGVMLYEMATGRLPFQGDTRVSVITAIMRDEPEAATTVNARLPRHLGRIIRRCLQKDPGRRYQSGHDLRNDLDDLRRELDSDSGSRAAAGASTPRSERRQSTPGSGSGGRERLAWMLTAVLALAVAVMGWQLWRGDAPAEPFELRIATSTPGGVYYPMGDGIARLLERHIDGLEVKVLETDGSFENMRLMDAGEADLALVQNDVAFSGTKTDRLLGYRSERVQGIGVLFEEVWQVIARQDSAIETVQDLRDTRFNFDLPGSGSRFTTELVLEHFGISVDDVDASFLWLTDAIEPLKNGEIDALAFWRALPAPIARDLFASGQFKLISIPAELIPGLRSSQPFLTEVMIPALTYPNQTEAVSTVAAMATLVANSSLDADLVYRITEVVFGNVTDLIAYHPRAADIDPNRAQRLEDGMAIDLHAGAERYRAEHEDR